MWQLLAVSAPCTGRGRVLKAESKKGSSGCPFLLLRADMGAGKEAEGANGDVAGSANGCCDEDAICSAAAACEGEGGPTEPPVVLSEGDLVEQNRSFNEIMSFWRTVLTPAT